jgi:hypothetical protein
MEDLRRAVRRAAAASDLRVRDVEAEAYQSVLAAYPDLAEQAFADEVAGLLDDGYLRPTRPRRDYGGEVVAPASLVPTPKARFALLG